jgi:hypothetical protein
MTTLDNLRYGKCEVVIDRTSPFGNPFNHRKLGITREDSVRKYKEWFYNKLKDHEFRDKVLALKDKKLGCWCVPSLCHGQVILEYLEGIPIEWPSEKPNKTIEDFI